MLSKLQKLREEREQGFTLIELLVVILIIGILAAIAIPAFLNQRKSAVDSSVQSDVSNAAKAIETELVKHKGQDVAIGGVAVNGGANDIEVDGATVTEIKTSEGTTLTVTDLTDDETTPGNGYKIVGTNPGGTGTDIVYNSLDGGLK